MHPKTPALLEKLGLKIVDATKWNLLLCVKKDDQDSEPTHVLKLGIDERKAESLKYETEILHRVLPLVNSGEFDCLVLPEFLDAGKSNGVSWLLMRYISGRSLVHEWSELNFKPEVLGGNGMDERIADLSVQVLRDLRMVDITSLPDFVRHFSFSEWLEEYRKRSQELVDRGLLEKKASESALELFDLRQVERYVGSMFTNGDFYPRNFILLPEDQIAVVDWVGGIDPWEFVAMHCWLMMWGNPRWQARYMSELKRHFPVDEPMLQVGLLVKSFDMVWRWKDEPEMNVGFARTQMLSYFRQCLDLDYVRQIFG